MLESVGRLVGWLVTTTEYSQPNTLSTARTSSAPIRASGPARARTQRGPAQRSPAWLVPMAGWGALGCSGAPRGVCGLYAGTTLLVGRVQAPGQCTVTSATLLRGVHVPYTSLETAPVPKPAHAYTRCPDTRPMESAASPRWLHVDVASGRARQRQRQRQRLRLRLRLRQDTATVTSYQREYYRPSIVHRP